MEVVLDDASKRIIGAFARISQPSNPLYQQNPWQRLQLMQWKYMPLIIQDVNPLASGSSIHNLGKTSSALSFLTRSYSYPGHTALDRFMYK